MMPTLMPAKKLSKYIKEQNPNCEISESFIRRLVADGELDTVRSGSKILISAESLEDYINKQLAR